MAAIVAVVASVAAVLVVALAQATSSGDTPVERAQAYELVAVVVGAAALVALAAAGGARGAGLGLLVAPVAALLAAGALVLVVPDLLRGGTTARFLRDVGPLALVLGLAGAGLGAAPFPRGSRRRIALVAALCTAVLGAGGALLVVDARTRLFGAGLGLGGSDGTAASTPDESAELAYLQAAVPTIATAFAQVDQVALAIDQDTTLPPGERADRVRTDVLPAVRAVQDAVEATATGTARLDEMQAHARTAVEQLDLGLRQFADALDAGDTAALQGATGVIARGYAERDEWVRLVGVLQADLGLT
ncbi:hypothetical protein [Cellulomonas persica]|uniref:DUF4129 domain-containing protein n=1 Tax=Cellulomonas persica TaxID=76861 RepID=A0A510UX41_9CELL|nr:hypothetical protein [Cellulomonas persica]GEK18081.1 hypothetical protein CPE01_18140 [Cellulomonas persica]